MNASNFTSLLEPRRLRIIQSNYVNLMDEVNQAIVAAGRAAEDVQVVGVTKYVDPPTAACLLAAGCTNLGENRPQSLWQKNDWLCAQPVQPPGVSWHVIGHLQRNKIKRTLPLIDLLHSVDSKRLVTALESELESTNRELDVLLEINITGEAAKTGLSIEDASPLLEHLRQSQRLRWVGLMGMASQDGGSSVWRRQFAALRQLRDAWQTQWGIALPHLSMGMSGDFAEAIAEGATLIRVGTRLFAGVEKES